MKRLSRRLARLAARADFLRDRQAVSSVEFAFIAPSMMLLLLAGVDCGRFVYATERVEAVAGQIGEMLAQSTANAGAAKSGDGLVASSDILGFYNAAPFIYPDILGQAQNQGVAWSNLLQLDMASVTFTATPTGCTTNCTYTPKVVWNYGASAYLRTCGVLLSGVSDYAAPSPSTLPTDAFGPNSLLVVDVHYSWQPTFGAEWFGAITVARSIYLNPRYVPLVEATSGNGVNICS